MNTLKQHLSLLIPLTAMLFSLQCLFILQRIVAQQESFITQKYAIGITSSKPITLEFVQSKIIEAKELVKLDPKDSLSKLTKDIEDSALNNLTKQLPYLTKRPKHCHIFTSHPQSLRHPSGITFTPSSRA